MEDSEEGVDATQSQNGINQSESQQDDSSQSQSQQSPQPQYTLPYMGDSADPVKPSQLQKSQSATVTIKRNTLVIVSVVALVVALIVGVVAGIAYTRTAFQPSLAEGRQTIENLNSQLDDLNLQLDDLSSQLDAQVSLNELLQNENDALQDQVDELNAPPEAENEDMITIISSEVTTLNDREVVEYVVRNNTDTTAEDISLWYRYLDADGNVVASSGTSVGASVDPGKTGTLIAYVWVDMEDYSTIASIELESATFYVDMDDGDYYDVDLPDEEPLEL